MTRTGAIPHRGGAISAIGARTGIKGADLERVVADVVAAGLMERQSDNPCLIILTNRGWGLASSGGRYGESLLLLLISQTIGQEEPRQ